MKKQKQVQTLFKYFQSDEYEMEQEKKSIELISYIQLNEEQPIFELILENCTNFVLDAQTSLQLEKLSSLIHLGINGCQIQSLIHLPLIDSLKRLTLDNNSLQGEQLNCIGYYKDKLVSLSLINNQLKIYPGSISLQYLLQIQSLKQLSLIGNIFESNEDDQLNTLKEQDEYIEMRNHIFNLMPNLIYLDCIERSKLIQEEKFFNNYNEENEYLSLYVSKSVTQNETSRSQSMISDKKNNDITKIREHNSKLQQQEEKKSSTRELRQKTRKVYNYD